MLSRKEFLKTTLTVTAASPFLSLKGLECFGGEAKKEFVYFDWHCHPGWSFAKRNFANDANTMLSKTVNEMQEGHLSGAFFSLVADAGLLKPGPTGISVTGKYAAEEGWKEYKRQLNQLKETFQDLPVSLSTDLHNLNSRNKNTIGFIAVEGGDFLEGQIARVEQAYQDGVRSIQLVHYAPNEVGDLQTADNNFNGLSSFGKDLVKKMNELGMAIDVAHASYQTTKDVAGITNAPIILSHSILEMDPDRPIAKRAISKDHAKIVVDTGGIIGAWPSAFNKSFDEFADNIKRLVDVAGIDHVGIGTDMDANFKPVLSNYTQYPKLAEILQTKGLSKTEVGKIMGENAKVVLAKIFKKKRSGL